MLIPDPVIIGHPARDYPMELGTLSGHGLTDSYIPGHRIIYNGEAEFSVNVSYVPDNPKWETLVVILQPKKPLPANIWTVRFTKSEVEKPAPKKQEEFPF